MVLKKHTRSTHGYYDQNLQSIKLSNEDIIRYKTLIFINNKTIITYTKSYEFYRFQIKLFRKDQLDY